VVVRVNDRGPFHEGRLIDLSYAAAVKLGITQRGTGRVEVRALTPGDDDKRDAANANSPASPAKPATPSAMDTLVAGMPASATGNTERRFDMAQNGKPMTAAEFDAWMKARRINVATGKPATVKDGPVAPTTVASSIEPTATANTESPRGSEVVLQIASFAARDNADRALSILRGAGIDEARVLDGSANGQKVWRLRVGPLQADAAPALAARIAGLGFGQPQRVRD
jgi:rare lipoprotein A